MPDAISPNPLVFYGSHLHQSRYHSAASISNIDLKYRNISFPDTTCPSKVTAQQKKLFYNSFQCLFLVLLVQILVLSGHDHDQCTITHSTPFGSATEHTLGTASWQQGNLYPSFMLLSVSSGNSSSVSNDDTNHLVSAQLCFLPMQTHIYIWYLCQALVTIVLLATWPTNGFSSSGYVGKSFEFIKTAWQNFTAKVKEKNDNEDCEYEMVWDAEGTMHLIKKAASRVNSSNADTRTVARGNAVSRATARKHQQDVTVEMGNQTLLEDPRLPSVKSNVSRGIQRLIRVVKLVVVIAAVNVPLYMMLLFKDWIER